MEEPDAMYRILVSTLLVDDEIYRRDQLVSGSDLGDRLEFLLKAGMIGKE